MNLIRTMNRDRIAARRDRKRRNLRGDLAVLAIMKNESTNLDEWMSHYFAVGADRIVLIDNGSTDDTFEKAKLWVAKGNVDLISLPERYKQTQHYWEAASRFILGKYEWLLIADLDEFWFCPDGKSLPAKLAEPDFATVDVIYANWRMFGSSGLVEHPPSIRRMLVHCDPKLGAHVNTKYMCRTSVLKSRRNIQVHRVAGANSARTVSDNENFNLFHYPIQSLRFFETTKMTRGDVLGAASDQVRDLDYFKRYDAPCTRVDRTLADLVDRGELGKIRTVTAPD